jgi:ApeA N-terminal domain 1
MNRRFKRHGTWWCPGSDPVAGELRFHPRTGLELRAYGNVIEQHFGTVPLSNTTVHGRLAEGDAITLFNLFPVTVGFPSRLAMQRSVALAALIGAHLPNEETETVDRIQFRLCNLNEWFGRGPLDPMNVVNETPIAEYRISAPNTVHNLGSVAEARGTITARLEHGWRGIGYRCNLRANYWASVGFEKPIPLSKALEVAHEFEILVSLLVGCPSLLREIVVWPSEELSHQNDRRSDRSGAFYIYRRVWTYGRKTWTPPIAIPFWSLGDKVEAIVTRWFALDHLKVVVHLLAGSLFGAASAFVEDRFLTLAQALEGYCRISLEGKYLDDAIFRDVDKRLKDTFPANSSSGFQEKFRNTLARLNEHTFRDRLLTLFEKHPWLRVVIADDPTLVATESQVAEFVARVVKARNTYTHVESKSRQQRQSITQWVVHATPAMRAMLCLLLLSEIGVDVKYWLAKSEENRRTVGWW